MISTTTTWSLWVYINIDLGLSLNFQYLITLKDEYDFSKESKNQSISSFRMHILKSLKLILHPYKLCNTINRWPNIHLENRVSIHLVQTLFAIDLTAHFRVHHLPNHLIFLYLRKYSLVYFPTNKNLNIWYLCMSATVWHIRMKHKFWNKSITAPEFTAISSLLLRKTDL